LVSFSFGASRKKKYSNLKHRKEPI